MGPNSKKHLTPSFTYYNEKTKAMAKLQGRTYEGMKAIRTAAVAAGRFGDPAELVGLCAYLCSNQARFITAQNMLIDGGKYPGTF